MKPDRIILASASPRRKGLLLKLFRDFDVVAADVDESIRPGESAPEHVKRLALEKARTVAARTGDATVISADTVVVLDGDILGKPSDAGEAGRMLRRLSGRTHTVLTAFCILDAATGERVLKVVESRVTMKAIGERELDEYIATGESLDKAGAYAIQGAASRFVERVEGSYTNVVGLPMDELEDELRAMGLISPGR